jgi:D-alanine transaminase
MPTIGYYDGQFVTPTDGVVPIEERGHQFGDGVYEVVRVYGGRPFLLEWHLERLHRSLRAVAIENPHTEAEWIELIGEAVRRSGEAEATIYFQVTRGSAVRTHVFPDTVHPAVSLIVRPLKKVGQSSDKEPYLLALPDERWANAYVKSINLLPNILAKESAHRFGAVEAMLVRDGVITEGAGSNIWLVRDEVLYTAPANRYILGGVTRRYVQSLAAKAGIPVCEEAALLSELGSYDEVFVTSTTMEIVDVQSVRVPHSLHQALQRLEVASPDWLLPDVQPTETLWRRTRDGSVTMKLRSIFSDSVERFRNYEDPLG